MHVSWWQDERPVWRLGCAFEVQRNGGPDAGRPEGSRLERVLAATGVVLAPSVALAGGQAQVTVLVRGADELDATHRGLSVVDVAVRQVPRLRLGELVNRSVTRASAPSALAVSGARR